ncbi:penicillin-binding protein [Weissella halotolerans]|uniref:Penicillin-binding protein 2B n=1 Tax=Weissella halotolerans DSM 20190 TaxID=1123500 RepID=A0A0R2G4H9_9LACO|nr:penicillin-binding protein [Weissella halotolerans]KRN31757.1 penicillin-binding protein 2B [Weissella halotolerans DSM 20190]
MVKKKRTSLTQADQNSRQTGKFLLFAMLGTLLVLGVRFSYVAITKDVNGHHLDQATQQLYQSQNVDLAKRGTIYDAVGNPLAENATAYTVVAVLDKRQVDANGHKAYVAKQDDVVVSQKLAQLLGGKATDYHQILQRGRKHELSQVQFGSRGSRLTNETYRKVKAAKIPGITFVTGPARFYPNGVYASNLIGLVAAVDDKKTGLTVLKGQTGIEAGWNKQLSGRNGFKSNAIDTASEPQKKQTTTKNGYDIYTTLNANLQSTLEKQVGDLDSKMAPKSVIAVVMDTKTGAIVAETQRPSFDSATGKAPGDFWSNELSQSAYEPGSVMKGVTLAAAIDTNHWDGDSFYRSGKLKVGDQTVNDWNAGQGWGTITYEEGLAKSSNVAMALTEQKIGSSTWHDYLQRFRFLKSTQSGLPNEATGSMQFRYPIEQVSTAFGQAISVTPLQMIQAYSAIAGDGHLIQPHVISKVVDPNTQKVVYEAKTKKVGQPIKQATAKATRKALEGVVYSDKGFGQAYAIPGYRTSGKSGTAQISTAQGYSAPGDSKNEIHSWIGMAPSDHPRYLTYVVVKQPQKDVGNVSKNMAQVFVSVMKQALQMSADDTKVVVSKQQEVKMPTIVKEARQRAEQDVKAARLDPVVMGDGDKVVSQYPAGGQSTLAGQRAFINTNDQIRVPNMHGWSKNDALIWARLANIKLIVKGSGFIATQSVTAGTNIEDGIHELTVELKQPKIKQ